MNRTEVFFLCVLVLAGSAGAVYYLVTHRPEVPTQAAERVRPLVETLRVEPRELRLVVKTQGTVTPRTESTLVAEVSGRVVAISPSLAAGGFFKADDVLVTIESTDFDLALTTAKAREAQAELALAQEQAEAEIARKEWEALGQKDREASPLTLRIPHLKQARSALAAAGADVEQARKNLERTRLRPPYDGRVREKSVDVGQFVNRGTAVARIYAVDYAEVRLPISADELGYLDLQLVYRDKSDETRGPSVVLRASLGGRVHEWTGRIVRTEGEIDRRSRLLYAVARVDDPYGHGGDPSRPPLAVGLFVHADIQGKLVDDVVELPRGALRGPKLDQTLVVSDDGRLHFRTVNVLRFVGERALIDGGLERGEHVVTTRLDIVVEGMKVRIDNEANETQPSVPPPLDASSEAAKDPRTTSEEESTP